MKLARLLILGALKLSTVTGFAPLSATSSVPAIKSEVTPTKLHVITTPTADTEDSSRRSFVVTSLVGAAGLVINPSRAQADANGVDYKAVAADIAATVKKSPDWGPTLVVRIVD